MNTLAWIGFSVMVFCNVYSFVAGTVKISNEDYPVAGVFLYWTVMGWFTWSCFHLLRFA